jgi:CheY-like chemotaxis protein
MPRIAWIEDDEHIIGSVVLPLERAGFVVDRYTTIAEATAALAKIRSADLVLMDVIVPPGVGGGSGTRYSGVEFMRTLSKEPFPPVVAFTVIREPAIHAQLRALGVSQILTKPVRPSILKATVEEALALRHTASAV